MLEYTTRNFAGDKSPDHYCVGGFKDSVIKRPLTLYDPDLFETHLENVPHYDKSKIIVGSREIQVSVQFSACDHIHDVQEIRRHVLNESRLLAEAMHISLDDISEFSLLIEEIYDFSMYDYHDLSGPMPGALIT